MKMLLTSGGLQSNALKEAFKKINTKPLTELKVAFILTASLVEPGDKGWVFKDIQTLYDLGVGKIDIVDIASLSPSQLSARLTWADCLFVEGGNTAYLMHSFEKSGLAQMLPELLKTRTYVGASAGSMIIGFRLPLSVSQLIYPEDSYESYKVTELLGWHNFVVVPHFGAEHMLKLTPSVLENIKQTATKPVYVLNDNSGLLFEDQALQVVAEGKWEKL